MFVPRGWPPVGSRPSARRIRLPPCDHPPDLRRRRHSGGYCRGGGMHYTGADAVATFIVAGIALAGVAYVVAFATESLGERVGPGATGLLQSTLGNLPEFFVVVFALQKGEVLVAQTSLIGSLLANGLLVLGLTVIVGASRTEGGLM